MSFALLFAPRGRPRRHPQPHRHATVWIFAFWFESYCYFLQSSLKVPGLILIFNLFWKFSIWSFCHLICELNFSRIPFWKFLDLIFFSNVIWKFSVWIYGNPIWKFQVWIFSISNWKFSVWFFCHPIWKFFSWFFSRSPFESFYVWIFFNVIWKFSVWFFWNLI